MNREEDDVLFGIALDEALAHLTPRQREVVRLIAEGYTQMEAAAALGVVCGSVSVQLMRARKKLRKLLSETPPKRRRKKKRPRG